MGAVEPTTIADFQTKKSFFNKLLEIDRRKQECKKLLSDANDKLCNRKF